MERIVVQYGAGLGICPNSHKKMKDSMEKGTHNLELLAPAGAWESMVAAVQNGADSVYLGGRIGNARQFAGNFREDEELERAIAYCHIRNVRVYVALNTLLLDKELLEAVKYAKLLYEMGADGCIVQDMGLVRLLRAHVPALSLHASTQMAIHDEMGIRMCAALGMHRVVLARELSLSRIHALSRETPIELECFAHGAMCTAISGMCLFSSLAGGRSGNRGACAQPCRKAYAMLHHGGREDFFAYPLSLEDMCMLFHIPALREAGVTCLKLEGRMKRPEYVSAMTRAYRMAIDGASKDALMVEWKTMQRIFSRGGGTGYYYSRYAAANVEAGLHGTGGNEDACKQERAGYAGENTFRLLQGELKLHVGEPASLQLTCGENTVQAWSDMTVERADSSIDTARYTSQIGKLGGTPFRLNACRVEMEEPAHISMAALNALRREAVGQMQKTLTGKRENAPHAIIDIKLPKSQNITRTDTKILATVPGVAEAMAAWEAGADFIALEPRNIEEAPQMLHTLQTCRERAKLLLQLPSVDISGKLREPIDNLFQSGLLDGGVAGHPSQIAMIRGISIAGYLCNVSNAYAAIQLKEMGFQYVILSLELHKAQLRDMFLHVEGAGLCAYGRAQMMQLWHCPQRGKGDGGCESCGSSNSLLQDEGGRKFPLDPIYSPAGCLTRLRNCDVLDILDVMGELPKPGLVQLEFFDETCEAIWERLRAARMALCEERPLRMGTTRGHWARGW